MGKVMVSETESSAAFPKLTRESAADTRSFSRLAEAVSSISVERKSPIAALDAQRMLTLLDAVCFDLTRRRLHQANEISDDVLAAFRKTMAEGEKEVLAVRLAMESVDRHWITVEERFGDAAPIIPRMPDAVEAGNANERLMKRAAGYLDNLLEIINDMLLGGSDGITTVEAQRKIDTVKHGCLMLTGETLSDVADRWASPLRRFRGPLQTPSEAFPELRKAYYGLEGTTRDERLRWDEMLRCARKLQWQARHDPAKFMVYVFRDADPSKAGEVLDLQWFHVSWFGVWLDKDRANSLIMAPPGHGKSFCVCAMDIWEAGRRPELRFLVLYDKGEAKVAKEIMRIEGIMQSDLFRAVFPEIRIMDRSGSIAGGEEGDSGRVRRSHRTRQAKARRHARTQYAFTVGRKNDLFSREATFEGAGALSNINGDGFDRIRGDDFSPPQCREEPYNRKRYAERFTSVVEERLRDQSDARIRVIHTPWHPEDAPGRIRKGIAQGKLPSWRCQVEPYAIRDDAAGKAIPLWPAKINSDHLEDRKFRLATNYDCCYRLQASDVTRRPLTKVMYYNAVEAADTPDTDRLVWQDLSEAHRTLSIDPAASDEKTACDTGVIDGRITLDGRGYVPNVWMLHLSSPKLLEWIVEQLVTAWKDDKHPYDELLIESQGGIKGMVDLYEDWLPKEFDRLGFPQALWPSIIKPGTRVGQGDRGQNRGKVKRLRECSVYVERGAVRLAGQRRTVVMDKGQIATMCEAIGGSDMAQFAGILKEFDGTTKADAVDALSQWILYNKARLMDPFAERRGFGLDKRDVKSAGPMADAMGAMMRKIMEVPDTNSSLNSDIEQAFGKWRPAGQLQRSIA